MLKKVEAKCKRCGNAFFRKRTDHEFCKEQCRNAAWKKPRKRRCKGTPLASVANGPFSSSKTVTCKAPSTPDWRPFIHAQIEAQQDKPNPVSFTSPDATKCRVWLASDREGNRIIGDDRWWRINVTDLLKQGKQRRPVAASWKPSAEALRRPIIVVGRNDPVRGVDEALQTLKGFKVRIYIESEKELQALGCGWRIVTCQFRGNKVLLHHNGKTATMKRKAFKELVAAIRLVRPKRRRPSLRLVVSNPLLSIVDAEAA
jgi:hypothetical protein